MCRSVPQMVTASTRTIASVSLQDRGLGYFFPSLLAGSVVHERLHGRPPGRRDVNDGHVNGNEVEAKVTPSRRWDVARSATRRLDDGHDLVGGRSDRPTSHGQRLAGVLVDDVAAASASCDRRSRRTGSRSPTRGSGRSARSSGPPPGGLVRLRLHGARSSQSLVPPQSPGALAVDGVALPAQDRVRRLPAPAWMATGDLPQPAAQLFSSASGRGRQARGAASSGADRPPGRLDVPTPRSDRRARPRLAGVAPGSEVKPHHVTFGPVAVLPSPVRCQCAQGVMTRPGSVET